MPRSRFVRPAQVRLYLADVYKRSHDDLITKGKTVDGKTVKATAEDIAASAAAVREAEADGHWIDVKKELNSGEQRNVFTNVVKEMRTGESALLDPAKVGITKMLEYLVGWSLDDNGTPVPISESSLNNLDTDTYREIMQAIDWHEEEQDKARTERKNGQGTESGSPATSPSSVS